MKNQKKKKFEYIETELHLVCHKLPPSNRKKKNKIENEQNLTSVLTF